ncbi:MAG: tetratricopeptide repeat protein [Candidatus Omnitrophica bacterium]|nr:tetratricopeptide repeat protein [Candidatus Omnitrophota bacterium]
MKINRFFIRYRWLFLREGFLYALVLGVVFMCVNVSDVVRSVKIRQLNDASAGINMSQLYAFSKGEIPVSAVDWQRLSAYFRLIMKFFPSQEDAEMFLGYCEYYGLGDKEAAFEHFRHSADNVPYYFWNLYDTGILLFQEGDMDHAVLYLEMALLLPSEKGLFTIANSILYRQFFEGGLNPDLLVRWNQARERIVLLLSAAYYFKGDYGMAEIFAMKGVTEKGISNREPFYFFAGAIAKAQKNYGEAASFFDQAMKEKSRNPLVYLYAAEVMKNTGRAQEAQKILPIGQALKKGVDSAEFSYPGYLRLEIF